ncbi:MAG: DUF6431 domain-containing protein [Clostridiales bacterium]|jgi:hypothetical protein|nr:DUF6431 domain-containing protein [Clostridiales bacterium]
MVIIYTYVLMMYGRRERGYTNGDGDKKALAIRRMKSPSCGKIHSELPDIIIPYKRHCAETIEGIITGGDSVIFDANLRYRILGWWTGLLTYFKGVMDSLNAKHGTDFSASPTPKEIVRAVANAHLWKSTRSE